MAKNERSSRALTQRLTLANDHASLEIGGVLAERSSFPPPSPDGAPQRSDAATARPRVLVIDDEEFICRAIKRTLGAAFDIHTTTDASAALLELEGGAHYDVILSDFIMPDMNGMELHERLRHAAPTLAANMIFVTGDLDRPAYRAFLVAAGCPSIQKPFTAEALRSAIRIMLDSKLSNPPPSRGR